LQLQPLHLQERVNQEIVNLLRPLNGPGNRLLVHFNKKSWVTVILTWNDSLFFFDFKNGFKVYSQKRFQLHHRDFVFIMPEMQNQPQ
jgi:hypothetical protein